MNHGLGYRDDNKRACWNVFLKIYGAAISPFFGILYAGSFVLVYGYAGPLTTSSELW